MAAYKGSVELISGITQKNGGNFFLMDAGAVQFDDSGQSVKDVLGNVKEKAENLEAGEAITEAEIAALF